jgi:hypothetical protein
MDRNRHMATRTPGPLAPDSVQTEQFLARSVAMDIGPRTEGALYYDGPRLVQVRQVITDRSEARRILKRKAAQFAVLLRDQISGDEYATCTVWTGSDRVLKAVAL